MPHNATGAAGERSSLPPAMMRRFLPALALAAGLGLAADAAYATSVQVLSWRSGMPGWINLAGERREGPGPNAFAKAVDGGIANDGMVWEALEGEDRFKNDYDNNPANLLGHLVNGRRQYLGGSATLTGEPGTDGEYSSDAPSVRLRTGNVIFMLRTVDHETADGDVTAVVQVSQTGDYISSTNVKDHTVTFTAPTGNPTSAEGRRSYAVLIFPITDDNTVEAPGVVKAEIMTVTGTGAARDAKRHTMHIGVLSNDTARVTFDETVSINEGHSGTTALSIGFTVAGRPRETLDWTTAIRFRP